MLASPHPDPLPEGEGECEAEPDYSLGKSEPGQGSPELRAASVLLDWKPPLEEKPPPKLCLQFSLGELFLLTLVTALMLGAATSVAGGTALKLEVLAGLIGLGLLAGMVVLGLFQLQSAAAIRLWWAMLVLYLVTCVAVVVMSALGGT